MNKSINSLKHDGSNEYVREIDLCCFNGTDSEMHDVIKNLYITHPNVVYVNLRGRGDLPVDTLDFDHLAKIKNLMFLDIYMSNLSYELECNEVKKFLDACPNLVEIDFAGECGLPFSILIDGHEVDFIWDEYQDVLNNVISIDSVTTQKSKKSWCPDSILARDYPHIKSWDRCRYK